MIMILQVNYQKRIELQMKQKIVIKVPIQSEKSKSKAMKIVVAAEGVTSVSLGKENDRLEIVGEDVDSVCLAICLRKKFPYADIVSVDEVKPLKPVDPNPPYCFYYGYPPF